MTTEELDRVLDCPMPENDSQATTVRGYLTALLLQVWVTEEGFSGKRPFGNSGWKWDVAAALALGGIIEGEVTTDEYGTFLDSMTKPQEAYFEQMVCEAIKRLGGTE